MDMIGLIKEMTALDTPRPGPRPAEETIAAPFARALLDLAVAKGAPRAELIARSGIDPEALEDFHARIPLARWVALVRIGSEAAGDPALALHFGETFDIGEMSVVGLIGRAVATKGEGLQMVNRFGRLVADLATEGEERFQLLREGRDVWMVDTRINPNETPEVTEAAFAQMAAMGRRMLPGVQHFRAVNFTHPAPAYVGEYERIFEVPVVFGSDRNAFLLPAGWAAEPIALQPRYSLDILTAYAERLLEQLDSEASMRGRVEALLAPRLSSGGISAAEAAARLGVTQQTLYRRLRAEGTTFVELLDALRHKLALHYLREKKLSAKETCYRLGFSDPAAFSRAFKRWTGSAPTASAEPSRPE